MKRGNNNAVLPAVELRLEHELLLREYADHLDILPGTAGWRLLRQSLEALLRERAEIPDLSERRLVALAGIMADSLNVEMALSELPVSGSSIEALRTERLKTAIRQSASWSCDQDWSPEAIVREGRLLHASLEVFLGAPVPFE
ncbi:MAG: hypothetical protein HGB18_03025 [Candidatus Moranbacteria bacterium]|nr:hypothetical protein [Candidatus Moranbacteria bacterium]